MKDDELPYVSSFAEIPPNVSFYLIVATCFFFTGLQRASFLSLELHLRSHSVVSKRKTQREEVRCLECQRLLTREMW